MRQHARTAVLWIVGSGAACALYVCWPRNAHLREFDPIRVAQLETGMWRSYYEHHYAALARDLYRLSRDEYGFSPCDSIAIAWDAARAAQLFQGTRSRGEAQRALPSLMKYYQALRAHGGETFDIRNAARLELEWWQQRREHVPPSTYGLVIAQNDTTIFHVDNADVRRAGLLRAAAMRYRDEHGSAEMREADWNYISAELGQSYGALLVGVSVAGRSHSGDSK